MKRDDVLIGSLEDFRQKGAALFVYNEFGEDGKKHGEIIWFGIQGFAFKTKEDIDEFIGMLRKLKRKLDSEELI